MSLSQQAYTQIKQRIVTLQLAPGSVVNEAQLLEELTFGRTPIREALQRLEREQLVTILPRRGIFVASIDVNDLQRLFEMRVPLEVLAVQLATQRGSSGHWDEMAHLLASAAVLPDSAEDALMEIDHACHALFWQAADNRFLEEQLTVLYALSLRMWHYSLPRLENLRFCVLEHHAMLDAVCQLQAGLAGQLMEQHIRAFQENIEQAIRNKWVAPHFEMEPSS